MKSLPLKFLVIFALLTALSGCGIGLCADGCLAQVAPAVSTLNLVPKWQKLEASWNSADGAAGYVLVRQEGSAVGWAPSDGTAYTVGQTVGSTHQIAFSGTWTTASDTSLTNGSVYHYQVFSYVSGYRYTPGPTAIGTPGVTCPTNYLVVAPNADVGASEGFCVAKYEMKNDGSGKAVTQPAGTPWEDMSRDDGGGVPVGPGAITLCRNIGSGYDLIANAQWQAVARDIEGAQTAGVYLNWSNGTTAGANAINRGHSDSGPNSSLAASVDSDPCFGTGNTNCANNAHADFTQKRTHTLSSGETIWDFGGNVYEWVKLDIVTGPPFEGSNTYVSLQPWTAGLNHPDMWGPLGNYVTKNSGEYGGLGYGGLGSSLGGVIRSGSWSNGISSGVFNAELAVPPLASSVGVGFRCVFVP